MIKICAWCEQEDQRDYQKEIPGRTLGQISHGICQNHALRLRHRYRRSFLRQTVENFPHLPNSTSK